MIPRENSLAYDQIIEGINRDFRTPVVVAGGGPTGPSTTEMVSCRVPTRSVTLRGRACPAAVISQRCAPPRSA